MTSQQLIWNLFIVIGCSYVVFWRGESGWWFLLAAILVQGLND